MVADCPRVLVVTNDFPPRVGGVQQYVWNLSSHLPSDRVAVLAPKWPGWQGHDREAPFPVHRWPTSFLWPTADLSDQIRSLVRQHAADVVLFGHGFPLPLPALATAMRRGLTGAREVTAVSHSTARSIEGLLPPGTSLSVLHPGVDEQRFTPSLSGKSIRQRFHVGSRPLIVCVGRLVPRKGQDVLIEA